MTVHTLSLQEKVAICNAINEAVAAGKTVMYYKFPAIPITGAVIRADSDVWLVADEDKDKMTNHPTMWRMEWSVRSFVMKETDIREHYHARETKQ